MSDSIQLTTHELWVEGRSLNITATKVNPTTLRLSWDLPSVPQAYDGAVVLLSESRFSSIHFPVDGTRYTASSNWASPADTINTAQVVAAFYGFFGDPITTKTVDVTNIDPTKLYYASIHAASNVLQYYTVGNQSYPLESSRFEKQSETYAGSIPTGLVPPSNPTNGQAYFDPLSNIVQVWNETMGAWVQGTQNTVPVGELLPIVKNQIFFNTSEQALKYFNGTSWTICDSTNTQVKMGAAWAPFNSVSVTGTLPITPAIGDFIYLTLRTSASTIQQSVIKFYSLGSWYLPASDLVRVLIPGTPAATWQNIVPSGTIAGSADISVPSIGDFFYQQSTRDLMVWTGDNWLKADTDNEGAPTTDKIGVGTDGSYDERLRLIKVLKHQLGWPALCVELSEEQFNVAIDNSLDEFRRRADNAYLHRHIAFTLKRGQSTYYLNDPRDKTDKIVNVLKIHRVNMLGISSLSAENGLYAQAFFNQLYQGSNVDVLSIHLMSQLAETYEKIFAGNLVFTWDEASRQLIILRNISLEQERVILEVVMERTEQELLLDRWAKQWLQGWAQSEALEMLGMIRSKYGNLPGPNGGITLNGDTLLNMATELQNELLRQITDYEAGNGGVNFGNTAFMIG
jgi:hypothetical protein